MTSLKSKQILLTVGLLASLFVGSASACTCLHHSPEPAKVDTESSSCHKHAENEANDEREAPADSVAPGNGCICSMSEQRAAAKSEPVKLKKLVAASSAKVLLTIERLEILEPVRTDLAVEPFVLSDPLYDLARKRGPPRA